MIILDPITSSIRPTMSKFMAAEEEHQTELAIISLTLDSMVTYSLEEINQTLAGIDKPGARPSGEFNEHTNFINYFPHQWRSRKKACQWAYSVLSDRPTFAVDGSQIFPVENQGEPVGYVQIGKIENPHTARPLYTKDVHAKIISGDELFPRTKGFRMTGEDAVNLARFRLVVEQVIEYMKSRAAADPKPVCFLEGPLILSFVQHLLPEHQKMYTDLMQQLLHTSEETQVPLVGYIDDSHATDLIAMASHIADTQLFTSFSDVQLFRECARHWGDRTRSHICARHDKVIDDYYQQVGFVYLRLEKHQTPARIEFPRWIIDAGILEDVMNIVRAECILGRISPSILVAADALVTITPEDEPLFYAIFQGPADEGRSWG